MHGETVKFTWFMFRAYEIEIKFAWQISVWLCPKNNSVELQTFVLFTSLVYINSNLFSKSKKDKLSSNCVASDELTYLCTVYYLHSRTASMASGEERLTAICCTDRGILDVGPAVTVDIAVNC